MQAAGTAQAKLPTNWQLILQVQTKLIKTFKISGYWLRHSIIKKLECFHS